MLNRTVNKLENSELSQIQMVPQQAIHECVMEALNQAIRAEHSERAKEGWRRRKERLKLEQVVMNSAKPSLVYLRARSDEGLSYQLERVNQHAKIFGYDCTQVFYDNESGSGTLHPFHRPGFSKLIDAASNSPRGTTIIALNPSRFTRSTACWTQINEHFGELGVDVLYVYQMSA